MREYVRTIFCEGGAGMCVVESEGCATGMCEIEGDCCSAGVTMWCCEISSS